MLGTILFAALGIAAIATAIGSDDDSGAEIVEDDAPLPVEEDDTPVPVGEEGDDAPPVGEEDGAPSLIQDDGLTVVTGNQEPEQIDVETLDENGDARVYRGSEADETVYIDPDTTSEFSILLGRGGGADTVITGLGQNISTTDGADADAEEADTVRLIYTPGASEELFEGGSVRGRFSMDKNDVLDVQFPEEESGTLLPVYSTFESYPRDACCSFEEEHELTLVYIPAEVEYSLEELESGYYHDWEALGMVPIADFHLGERGEIDFTHEGEGGEFREWDYVREPPTVTSNLAIERQITIHYG
ncbi:hypothetical protein KBY29_15750 [Ruegeria pomeroyi]|nr:hypothetical protein [Ruegeria pomeroyi]